MGQDWSTITNNYQQLSTIIDGQDKATIINNYLQSCVKGMDDKRLIEYADLIYDIIGAAHEVHNELRSGLSEAIYEEALCVELSEMGIEAAHQVELPVFYKGYQLEKHYRLDIVVEDDIIIELKAVDKILSEHRAQLFNYLRITKKPIGLLLNFGKSVYVEKYIYDADTNDVSLFSTKSNRG